MLAAASIGPLGPVGKVRRSYSSAAELPATIEWGVGDVRVDLSRLQLLEGRDLAISVRAGTLALQLPVGVASEIEYNVMAGEYNGIGGKRDGLDLTGTETVARGSGGPVLRIRVDLDVGNLRVSS